MASTEPAKRHSATADSIATTLEWLITAFILAFVFRAFVMEAFRIPTGSMADTLKGAHYRLRCTQCGYKYDYGFAPYWIKGATEEYVPPGNVQIFPPGPRCPSCGYRLGDDIKMPVANGDRILVLKTIYQFIKPNRWDVIVFKNPTEPRVNYIKRLIARPGETLEIIDGDIYINGLIARKPPAVQDELWMPVYDNDYKPVQPEEAHFNGHSWRQPFKNINDSKWQLTGGDNPALLTLDSPSDKINTIIYDTAVGNNFQATYAYDEFARYEFLPIASDLKIRFFADFQEAGIMGAALSKYETTYRAWADLNGQMIIFKSKSGQEPVELARTKISPLALNKNILFEFANVDHRLVFKLGADEVSYDLGRDPNSAGERKTDLQPQLSIFGSGKLKLSHVAVFRDIHYLDKNTDRVSRPTLRAGQGNPIKLREDEFFAMGDNSPNSSDSRYWNMEGVGNAGKRYREGIVPRDYLVGKALFVYWPSGFRLFNGDRWGLCPNIGEIRFIYGGKDAYSQ